MENNISSNNVSSRFIWKGYNLRFKYFVYFFIILFIFLYGFLWLRPSPYFFIASSQIPLCDQQYVQSRFGSLYDNPISGAYMGFFVKKVEILDKDTLRLYGWFNEVLFDKTYKFSGGEHPCNSN